MAVNDNDRVTSRRLKQFWDLAKQWIQTLVSGAINTSETAMETSMDTKIQAAKPNYNMPNENDQIGVGYGWNEVDKLHQNVNSQIITLQSLAQTFSANGKISIIFGTNLEFMRTQTSGTARYELKRTVMQILAGKFSILPAQLQDIYDNYNNAPTEWPTEWLHSTYDGESLISPVYEYNGHTYQTKLTGFANANEYFNYLEKVDDGDFTAPAAKNICFIWCLDWKTPLCEMANGMVSDNAVSTNSIKNAAVTYGKLDTKIRPTLIQHYSYALNNTTYRLAYAGTSIKGLTIEGLYANLIDNSLAPFPLTTYTNTQGETGFQIPLPSTKTFSLSDATLYGHCYLKTDTDFYECPIKLDKSRSHSYVTAYFMRDTEISNHLNDTNAYLYLIIPIQTDKGYEIN